MAIDLQLDRVPDFSLARTWCMLNRVLEAVGLGNV